MSHLNPEILGSIIQSNAPVKNSIFTLRSIKSNVDYTFKLVKKSYANKMYIHIYVEYGYLNFKYLGFYSDGKIIKKGNEIHSATADGIAWLLRTLTKHDYEKISQQAELLHIGKCVCCGRSLTDAVSIEIGIGPYCRTKH